MASLEFNKWIKSSFERKKSNIILALDLTIKDPKLLIARSLKVFEETVPYICAVKINRQLTLPLGLYNGIHEIIRRVHANDLPAIMDCKINDVGHTNKIIAQHYFKAGFDAVTVNPIVGWRDGIQPVFELARKMRKGVIILVYMSHGGSVEGYGQLVVDAKNQETKPQYLVFAERALEWLADGVIVGATYPEKIREVHEILGGEIPIYSPGVGYQGGSIGASIRSGASYLIVGRSILLAKNPAESAKKLQKIVLEYMK